MNIQGWFPFGLTCCPRDSQEPSLAPQFESINSSVLSLLYGTTLISTHDYWKTHSLTLWTFDGKVPSLLFHMLSGFVIAFLPRSKSLLISQLQSLSTVILKPKKIKPVTVSIFPLLFTMKWWDGMMLNSKTEFSLSSCTLKKKRERERDSLVPLHFLPLEWYHLKLLMFLVAILIPACDSSSLTFCVMYTP